MEIISHPFYVVYVICQKLSFTENYHQHHYGYSQFPAAASAGIYSYRMLCNWTHRILNILDSEVTSKMEFNDYGMMIETQIYWCNDSNCTEFIYHVNDYRNFNRIQIHIIAIASDGLFT